MCEHYQLAPNWNKTPLGPSVASDHITTSSCIRCIKLLFGEVVDSSTTTPVVLPQNWGNMNRNYVRRWICDSKLTKQIKVELEMHQKLEPTQGKKPNTMRAK